MPRSMTGFGTAEGEVSGGRLQIKLKTVNHRHFSTQLKVPGALVPFDANIRQALRAHIDRGHVTVAGRWIDDPTRASGLVVDLARARDVYAALKALKKHLKIKEKIGLDLIARQPDVMSSPPVQETSLAFDEIKRILDDAASELVAARQREGKQLGYELANRLAGILEHLEAVEQLAPDRVIRERDRLRTTIADLVDGHTIAEDRLAQEVAFLADKMDITEEIVRLKAHVEAATDALASKQPVGKQLTFLAQEMLREINTIGSKANDADIAQRVIAMKGELEKIREQVENLE